MDYRKFYIVLVLSLFQVCVGKSLFCITDHGLRGLTGVDAKISAFSLPLDANDLAKVMTLDSEQYPTGYYFGPVAIVADDTKYLFVNHEDISDGIEGIQLIHATTMTDMGIIDLDGHYNFAGIIFDSAHSRIFTITRNTDQLYVFDWDADALTLTEDESSPFTLSQIGDYGCGLAFDEETEILYVTTINYSGHSSYGNLVYCYDAEELAFTHTETIAIAPKVSTAEERLAVAVAVYNDGQDTRYLYTGSYGGNYLVRTDLNHSDDPNYQYEKQVAGLISGIAVDPATGLVYVSMFGDPCDMLALYDTSDWTADPNDAISPEQIITSGLYGPAGLCVPAADISYKPPAFYIDIDPNDAGCIAPTGSNTIYNITWDANDVADANVVVKVMLPVEVDFVSCDPAGGAYDPNDRSVSWVVGAVTGSSDGLCSIETTTSYYAAPGSQTIIRTIMEGDTYYSFDDLVMDICVWGGEIIHVDPCAVRYNNGTTWQDAYTDLQTAIQAAENCDTVVTAIWVAAGTYLPVTPAAFDSDASFELLSDVALLGHFAGTESSPAQRQLDNPAYTSWLKGQIDATHYVKSTVTAADISNAVLDGFKITTRTASVYNHGVDMDNASVLVRNCTIAENYSGIYADQAANVLLSNSLLTGNYNDIYLTDACAVLVDNALMESYYGVYADNESDVRMNRCAVAYQSYNGISCNGGSLLTLHNSEVYENGYANIALSGGSDTEIVNNWIYKSDGPGIAFTGQVSSDFVIRNNTICDNDTYGIYCQSGTIYPAVSNCIIVGNSYGDLYQPASFTSVNYCVLQNGHSGQDNMVTDPCFIDASYTVTFEDPNFPPEVVDPNNYHLAFNSPCKDAGDTAGFYLAEDFDGDARIWFGRADIGADEFTDADLNDSNRVDLADFNMLASVYDTADTACDFNGDSVVDLDDMTMMCQVWLTTQPIGGLTLTMEPDFMVGGQMASMMMPLSVPLGLETLSPEETTAVYYAMDPAETLSARQDQLAADIAMLEDMLYWMDTIALIDPDLPAADQKAWDEFYKALEQQLKRLNHLAQRL